MPFGTHSAVEDSRNKDIYIFINDEFYKRDEAKISVYDSGYLVGDGVWEALRLHDGVLVFKEEHLTRLWAGAATIGMTLPFSKEELLGYIEKTLEKNNMQDGVHVRIMVTRGIKKTPSQDPRLTISGPNVVIIPEYKLASADVKKKGISLYTSTIRRGSPDYLDPKLNCHSKLHEVQALIQAIEAGADEALMLDVNGFVSTCNATNFFIVKGDEVWTSTGQYCMNGITRAKVLEACAKNNIVFREINFSLFDTYSADEAFVTGTFGALTPVATIDGRLISDGGAGPVTLKLQSLYNELIQEYIEEHK